MKVMLELPWPPSVNHRLDGSFHLTPQYREWRTACTMLLHGVRGRPAPAYFPEQRDIVVDIRLDERMRETWRGGLVNRSDVDNRCKAVLDVLAVMGVYQNDFQVVRMIVEWSQTGGIPCWVSAWSKGEPKDGQIVTFRDLRTKGG